MQVRRCVEFKTRSHHSFMLPYRQLAAGFSDRDSGSDSDVDTGAEHEDYEKSRLKLVALHELVSERLQQHVSGNESASLPPPLPALHPDALASDGDVSGAEDAAASAPMTKPVKRSHHKQGGRYNAHHSTASSTPAPSSTPRRNKAASARLTMSPAKSSAGSKVDQCRGKPRAKANSRTTGGKTAHAGRQLSDGADNVPGDDDGSGLGDSADDEPIDVDGSTTSREQDELLYRERWAPGCGPCCFCGEFNDDPNLARMVKWGDGANHYAHAQCLLWSPEVYLESGDFINAFDAYRRSRSLKCAVCKLPGANVGCCVKSCAKSFHIGCVIKAGLQRDDNAWSVNCRVHAGVNHIAAADMPSPVEYATERLLQQARDETKQLARRRTADARAVEPIIQKREKDKRHKAPALQFDEKERGGGLEERIAMMEKKIDKCV